MKQLTGNKNRAELLKLASGSFIMKITGIFVSLLFAFFVANIFGAGAWGEFSLAFSYLILGSILGSAGLDFSLLKLTAGIGKKDLKSVSFVYKKAMLVTILVSSAISLLFYLQSGWIAVTLFGISDLTTSFQIASLGILPVAITYLNTNTLQGLKKITLFAFLQYVSKNLFGILFLVPFLWALGDHPQIVLISFLSGLVVIAISSQLFIYREGISVWKKTKDGNHAQKYEKILLKIAVPLLLTGVLLFLKNWIDTIMVGVFMQEADVGVYTIALKIAGLLNIFFISIGNIMAPKISEMYEKGKTIELENLIQYSSKLSVWLTLPFLLILLLFSDFILSIFGGDFIAGKYTLMILATGFYLNIAAGPVGHFLNMTESQKAYRNITFLIVIIGIGLNYLLIPLFGLEGAAAANLISLLIWNGFCITYIRKKYKMKTYYLPFRFKEKLF
jgi:O-antigen/teichoic acid export membrane protein